MPVLIVERFAGTGKLARNLLGEHRILPPTALRPVVEPAHTSGYCRRRNTWTNQTATAHAVRAASMAVAARNASRGEWCGVTRAQTRKVGASSGATRIRSTE